jgi:hypothetical protein
MRIPKLSGPMNKELLPSDSIIVPFLTLEEFKISFSKEEANKSILEKISDIYDKSIYLKIFKNFDPTGGFISCVADGLSDIKAKRNEEKVWNALYGLFKGLYIIDQKIGTIDRQYYESQVIALIEMYFDHSMSSYQLEKIEIFKNAFIRGVLDYDRTLDEKENMFNIISSLTIGHIRVLKFIYDRINSSTVHKDEIVEELGLTEPDLQHPSTVHKDEIVEELGLTEPHLQLLCHDLIGRGLLIGNHDTLRLDGYGGYISYFNSDYIEILIKYIKEPVDANIY